MPRRRQLGLAALALVCLCLAAAALHASDVATAMRLAAFMVTGPALGWWIAIADHSVSHALPFLLVTTAAPASAFASWVFAPRHSGLLGLAVLLWFMFGWYISIGMWI